MSEFVPEKDVNDFFVLLNQNKIRYFLIKNIAQELPKNLNKGKDIDIVVHPDDKIHFAETIKKNGFLYRIHPFGTEHGWKFAYGLEKPQFWQKKECRADFFIDVCFRLCVKSFTPKTWVPLDEKINSRIWQNQIWNKALDCPCLDEKTLLVYLFARCVFDKRDFSEKYIAEIENIRCHSAFDTKPYDLLDDSEVHDLLSCDFYNFTNNLIQLAKADKYNEIVQNFLSFKDY